jgi:hypothetical protein
VGIKSFHWAQATSFPVLSFSSRRLASIPPLRIRLTQPAPLASLITMASFLRFSAVLLLSVALLSGPAQAAESRKLLQQINIPVTAQCINILDNSQVANIPNLNVGIIQVIAGVLGAGGQAPSAIFFNSESVRHSHTNVWFPFGCIDCRYGETRK